MNQLLAPINPSDVVVTRNSLQLNDQISDESIALIHKQIEEACANIKWLKGDFYREVARVRPTKKIDGGDCQLYMLLTVEGNERVKAMMADSVEGESSERMACRVGEVLEPSERLPLLSWGHHYCVLEEFLLAGGVKFDREAFLKRKGEALQMLRFVDRERQAGNVIPINELRKIVRMRQAQSEPASSGSDSASQSIESPVGNAIREMIKGARALRGIKVVKITEPDRVALQKMLKPFLDLAAQLESDSSSFRKKESL